MNNAPLTQHRLSSWLHSILLLTAVIMLLGAAGWVLAGPEGVLWTVAVTTLLLVFGTRLSPQALLRMQGARPLGWHRAPELHELMDELARRAGLADRPQLFYLPQPVPNAFTLGGRDEAAVVVTEGLLRTLSWRELTGVLAHEMSHISNNDTHVMGLAELAGRLTRALASAGTLLFFVSLPLLLLGQAPIAPHGLLLLLAAPTLSALLRLALSRTRELHADVGAVHLTGDPLGLASALRKLEAGQRGLLERLFGAAPTMPGLLRTHPHTRERIDRLLALGPPRALPAA